MPHVDRARQDARTMMKNTLLVVGALVLVTATVGCTRHEDAIEETEGEVISQPIVNGQSAAAYTEAALINGQGFICSGAIIAPRVALTAGHCIEGSSFNIVAPYSAGKQSANGTKTWTQYVNQGETVNRNTLDVAVIILDKAITLPSYPSLASAAVAVGTQATNVGRIRNQQASFSQLFFGASVSLKAGASYGFPYAYVSTEVIESGDSGGPVYVGSGANRTIVAVNSGAGGGTQILARVDLAYAKIQELIAANGGTGGGGGTTTTPPTTTPPTTPPTTPATCASNESEPNNDSNSPSALGAKTCGALATGTDVDWFTWSVSGAGVAYDLELTASGDADLLMWKDQGTGYTRITNATPTSFAATSSAAGTYVVAVRSAGASAQTYSVALTN